MKLTLYQTLNDLDNPDEIENQGPFKCTRSDAWLGHGYYFWEGHIQLGHFWGKKNYNDYVICKASATLDEYCYDLYNRSDLRIEFDEVSRSLVKSGITSRNRLLVSQVIEFLKKRGQFKYKSIRILGTESIKNIPVNNSFINRIKFKFGKDPYLDLVPQIQICLIEKNALSLRNFSIVYPSHYIGDLYA